MTREEALAKFELDEDASFDTIQEQFNEFKSEFEMRIENAPTEHQKKLYQKKLVELEDAFILLTPAETNESELPSSQPTKPSAKTAKKEVKEELTEDSALKFFGLTTKSTISELEKVFQKKKSELDSKLNSASSESLKVAIGKELEYLDSSFSLLSLTALPDPEPEVVVPAPEPEPIPEPTIKEEKSDMSATNVSSENLAKPKKKNKAVLFGTIGGIIILGAIGWFLFGGGTTEEIDPIEKQYLAYINEADSLVQVSMPTESTPLDSLFTDEYDLARDLYTKALGVKPNDVYAEAQIKYLDSLLEANIADTPEGKKDVVYITKHVSVNNNEEPEYEEEVEDYSTGELSIGNYYAGGIIFELNGKGGGKVIQKEPNGSRIRWGDATKYLHSHNGFNDWRAPSHDEMKVVFKSLYTKGLINLSEDEHYWCRGQFNMAQGNSFVIQKGRPLAIYDFKTKYQSCRYIRNF